MARTGCNRKRVAERRLYTAVKERCATLVARVATGLLQWEFSRSGFSVFGAKLVMSSPCVFAAPRPRGERFSTERSARSGLCHEGTRSGSVVMAKVCEICGRGPQFGNRISHAHNVNKRRWNVNLQTVHAVISGAGKRIRVCTSCIRSGKVQKAPLA